MSKAIVRPSAAFALIQINLFLAFWPLPSRMVPLSSEAQTTQHLFAVEIRGAGF